MKVFFIVFAIQEALNYLKAGACIILTSSIRGVKPSVNLVNYAMTKSSLILLTNSIAARPGEKGIRINTVVSGPIWTALQISRRQQQDSIPEFGQDRPLGRAVNPQNSRALM